MIGFQGKVAIVLILFLTGISWIGCDSDNPHTAVIKGNIQFPPAEKIYFFSYADTLDIYLERKSAIDSSMLDRDRNFSFSLPLKMPCAFDLMCGNKNLAANLFISPGDKIKIYFLGKNQRPEIISSGQISKQNQFLIEYSNAFYIDTETKEEYYIGTNYMDIHQFTSYNETRKQKQIDFFYSFFKDDSLKKDFKDYVLNTINYGIAVDRLMYLWKKRMKSENISVDSSYFDFVTPAFVENKDALNCPAYIRFLNLYIKDIYERKVERGELPRDKSDNLIPAVEKYRLAAQLLNKPFRDVVLSNIIFNDMHNVSEEKTSQALPKLSMDSMTVWFKNKYSLN